MKPIWPGLALCGLLLAACAHEEERNTHHHHGPPGRMMQGSPVISSDVFLFLPYDADHDHRVTRSELSAAIDGSWRDAAGSAKTLRLLALQDWFARLDGAGMPFNALEFAPDGGDSVTRDQFAAALTRRFAMLDKNADGVLEPSEFMTVPRIGREGRSDMGGGEMPRRRR